MKSVVQEVDFEQSSLLQSVAGNKLTVSAVALMSSLAATAPAWATIDNTVTVTGSSPGNTDDVTNTASETVDVQDAAPNMAVTKTAVGSPTEQDDGDTITYNYTVENTGNVTLTNVSLAESHEGTGTAPVPLNETLTTGTDSTDTTANDGVWSSLAPGEIVTWSATYTVTAADVSGQVDNDLDNTVTASATPAAGTLPAGPFTATESVDLLDQPSLSVTKVATLLNGGALADPNVANAAVGDIITYTYTVTNDGNVPITAVSLSDNVTAGTGGNPTPTNESLLTDNNTGGDSSDGGTDGTWDTLGVGDVITFTGTYTVTQSDVDNLQ